VPPVSIELYPSPSASVPLTGCGGDGGGGIGILKRISTRSCEIRDEKVLVLVLLVGHRSRITKAAED
jgi:hypothetical protein